MRILIVEDDEGIRDSLKAICKEFLGHEVISVGVGKAAIDIASFFKPQMALLDNSLPDMNGTELARHIKDIAPYCRMIMVSGSTDIDVAIKAMKAGCEDYIKKPFEFKTIERVIEETEAKFKYAKTLEESEIEQIDTAIATTDTLEGAAKKLGINTATLWRKRKQKVAV